MPRRVRRGSPGSSGPGGPEVPSLLRVHGGASRSLPNSVPGGGGALALAVCWEEMHTCHVLNCVPHCHRSPDPGQPVAIGGRALQRRSGNMRAPESLGGRDWCPSHGEIGHRHTRGRREGRQEGTQGGGRLEVAWARSSLPASSLATPGSGPQPPGRGMTVV